MRKVLRDLGIDDNIPNDLSIALGTSNLTLLDLVKGYSAFANGGGKVSPIMVRRIADSGGETLEENGPISARAMDREVAFKMNTLLKGVTTYGTAKEASPPRLPCRRKDGHHQ